MLIVLFAVFACLLFVVVCLGCVRGLVVAVGFVVWVGLGGGFVSGFWFVLGLCVVCLRLFCLLVVWYCCVWMCSAYFILSVVDVYGVFGFC